MIPVLFCVRLHLCVSSSLAFSLPQSRPLILFGAPAPSSEGAEAALRAAVRAQYASVRYSAFRIPHSELLCATTPSNVRARRALLRFSCTRRVRFIQLCCASYAAGVLHLRRPCRLTAPTYIQSPIRFAGEPDLRVHPQSSYAGGGCSHQRFCRRRYSFLPKFAPESACAPWRFRHCA